MAVLILVAVGVLAFRGGSRTAGVVTSLAAFSLPALSRKGWVSLAGYRGKPVVVNFFASWCPECQAALVPAGARQRSLSCSVSPFKEVRGKRASSTGPARQ
jgi:thiol-disulfide isomerase/thioredoxin